MTYVITKCNVIKLCLHYFLLHNYADQFIFLISTSNATGDCFPLACIQAIISFSVSTFLLPPASFDKEGSRAEEKGDDSNSILRHGDCYIMHHKIVISIFVEYYSGLLEEIKPPRSLIRTLSSSVPNYSFFSTTLAFLLFRNIV